MKAAFYRRTGPAREVLEIGTVPDPEPGIGEVRVRLAFSGVNPSDVKTRSGRGLRTGFDLVIPHSDGAGVVDRVGAGVPADRIGQRVWTWNAQIGRPFGTAAGYVVLPSAQAVALPHGVPDEAGACLGVPWLTAWRAVHHRFPDRPGDQTVLITGGAGTVGGYAVQLARRAGFRVIATVSSDWKAEVAQALGAHHTVDYRREDVAARMGALAPGGVDRVIEVDLATNASLYPAILARGGLAVIYGSSDWNAPLPLARLLVHGAELALFSVYEMGEATRLAALRDSAAVLDDPSFRHRIAATYPLERTAEAHEAVESGAMIGNVLLDLSA